MSSDQLPVAAAGEGVSAPSLTAAQENEPRIARRAALLGAALVALVISSLFLYGALAIEVRVEQPGIGPRTWPIMLGSAAALLAVCLFIQGLVGVKEEQDNEPATKTGLYRLGVTVALTAAGLFAWKLGVSYLIWMPVLMITLLVVYGMRGWRGLIIVPAVVTALIYFVFDLLLKVAL